MTTIDQKYIVIAFTDNAGRNFLNLISCDADLIIWFVSELKIGSVIMLCFYSVEKLNSSYTLDVGDALETVYMNNSKSFEDFSDEVIEVLEKLEIIEEKKEK